MEYDKWAYQKEARECFLQKKHGILEMATGTGKTRTAIGIMQELFEKHLINQVLVIAYGNDLLEQWYKELLLRCPLAGLFRWFGKYHEFSRFQLSGQSEKIALISREPRRAEEVLEKVSLVADKTLLVFDEVHGAGAEAFRKECGKYLVQFPYRLGLSATPVRSYDEEGNQFLEHFIGPVIFRFGLEDAIRRGVLCSFQYTPLDYQLTKEEKKKKRSIIAAYEKKKKIGILFEEEAMYRELARVNKLAESKLNLFESYLKKHPEILERCIIFVETKEYGLKLQQVILKYFYNFHTYYGNDERENLEKFTKGQLKCLITCKKISEGIDICSVRNIVLFSSDRGHLVTTQRIGRSLRKDPNDKEKRAHIIDFICSRENGPEEDTTADQEREKWLKKIAEIREEIHGII